MEKNKKEFKIGDKVKIPKTKSSISPIKFFNEELEEINYNKDFLYIKDVTSTGECSLNVDSDFPFLFHCAFNIRDLEHYEEEKKYTIDDLRLANSNLWIKCENKKEANLLWEIGFKKKGKTNPTFDENVFPVYIYLERESSSWMPFKYDGLDSVKEWIKKEHPKAQIINFNQVIFEENMEIKEKQIPQTFAVKGKEHHLICFMADLEESGYIKHKDFDECKFSQFIHNNINRVYNNNREDITLFKNIGGWNNSFDQKNQKFTLPEQYSEALQFCKEQLKIAEEYFKEEIPEYVEVIDGGYCYTTHSDAIYKFNLTKYIQNKQAKTGKIHKVLKKDIVNGEDDIYIIQSDSGQQYIINIEGVIPSTKEAYEAQNRLTFGGNEVTIEQIKNTASVFDSIYIKCKGETGTYKQLERIYDKHLNSTMMFGKAICTFNNVENVKIGCTTGTLTELRKILEKCNELLDEKK